MTKDERLIIAENHNEYMISNFAEDTKMSFNKSILYEETKFETKIGKSDFPVIIEDLTSEKAVSKYSKADKLGVLNFASFTRPGGGFIKGAIAQEEALCHASNLYNVLNEFRDIYNINYSAKNRQKQGLYMNWGIFSPGICFIYNEKLTSENYVTTDVITVPCPNYKRWTENGNSNDKLFNSVLKDRIKFVLDIAQHNNVKTLILGAFGCGVFGNNPETVASYFKECFEKYKYNFDKVIFAIPKGKDNNNLESFKKVWK